ncbi:TetR/AcrR family transcriptional regulator [Paenibacillus pinihumi]|uniref:TetR/AcrR family transcriptional regulator n=1 Tax=Paenibacillus pinihumi TaxID=669462 RepID=UPI00041196C9|nr:TetR/AcrR family transcriptional regulator [Paenibacillus pinihumi]
MARTREFDEQKVLDAAMRLFWEKGYEATSLSDLTAAMGVQRPSIYSAFGDKKELFEAALRKYNQLHAASIRTKLKKFSSVKQAFRSLFEGIITKAGDSRPDIGCFCINTMVELAPHDPKFEVLTREHQLYLASVFQETIERGLESGELRPDIQAEDLAKNLVVSMIGLTVMMKSRPEQLFAEQSIALTLSLLD